MKLTLVSNDSRTLKIARKAYRRNSDGLRITFRHGQAYTMRYNPGVQPRTETQEKSWALFKEANARVAADFADPSKKAHWVRVQKQQSRYKTARGLARAHYISLLKSQIANKKQDIASSTKSAATSLRLHSFLTNPQTQPTVSKPSFPPQAPFRSPQSISWTHHRNVHWWRSSLSQL